MSPHKSKPDHHGKHVETHVEESKRLSSAAAEKSAEREERRAEVLTSPSSPTKPIPKTVFEIQETKTLSVNGVITTMHKGTHLDPDGYGGLEGIEHLRQAGLVLKQVEV